MTPPTVGGRKSGAHFCRLIDQPQPLIPSRRCEKLPTAAPYCGLLLQNVLFPQWGRAAPAHHQ
jgi:hypothetical protein